VAKWHPKHVIVWPILLATVLGISAAACLGGNERRISVERARTDALEHVERGATEAEIESYLDARGYLHTPTSRAGTETNLKRSGVPEDALVLRGFIADSSRSSLIEGHIILYFVLDSDRRFDHLLVVERLEGP